MQRAGELQLMFGRFTTSAHLARQEANTLLILPLEQEEDLGMEEQQTVQYMYQ